MHSYSIRLGVDIGGTFTDVVLEIDKQQYSTKVLTTYAAPENAIIDGMHQVCQKAGIQASDIEQIIHGTTLQISAWSLKPLDIQKHVANCTKELAPNKND